MSSTVSTPFPSRTSGVPVVEFGRSSDGMLVARVGDTGFAMVAKADGSFYLANGWRLSRPLAEWSRNDFYGHGGDLADEAAFRVLVAENAEHQRQKAALRRQDVFVDASTPWGPSQGVTRYSDGVTAHSTASHGGFHIAPDLNRKISTALRRDSGWYEEDCEWAIVAITFTDLFTTFERRLADDAIRNWWPDAWEAIHGQHLLPGESRERDRESFERAHDKDWIVISAIRSNQQIGFTEVIATRGGARGEGSERRRFLLPSKEYHAGPFGFIVDEAKYPPYDGPSNFAGWSNGRSRP